MDAARAILNDASIDHNEAMDRITDIWIELGMCQSFAEFCEGL